MGWPQLIKYLFISVLAGFIFSLGGAVNIYWHFIGLGLGYFFTLHFPRNMDDHLRALKIMQDYGFSFEQLYALEMRENMKTLDISHFPLLMILDRERNIIYRGNLCTAWYERIYRVENILRKEKKKEHDP